MCETSGDDRAYDSHGVPCSENARARAHAKIPNYTAQEMPRAAIEYKWSGRANDEAETRARWAKTRQMSSSRR